MSVTDYLLESGHVNVVACIEAALHNPTLLADAETEWRSVAADVFSRNNDREGLRISDAGQCSLQVYATIHGLLDVAESTKALLRMDKGKAVGAWLACLTIAGLRELYPHLDGLAEPTVSHDGTPGHVDLVIRTKPDLEPVETIEFKSTSSTFTKDECKPGHRIQSGKYALATGALRHQVVTHYDALPDSARGKWIGDVPVLWPHYFTTEETRADVEADFARLAAATDGFPPEPDVPKGEEWLCRYCRYSGCAANVNPLLEVIA